MTPSPPAPIPPALRERLEASGLRVEQLLLLGVRTLGPSHLSARVGAIACGVTSDSLVSALAAEQAPDWPMLEAVWRGQTRLVKDRKHGWREQTVPPKLPPDCPSWTRLRVTSPSTFTLVAERLLRGDR